MLIGKLAGPGTSGRQVRRQIAEFRAQQTRLIVSHKPEALWATDWVVRIEQGRFVQQGEPAKVLAGDILVPDVRRLDSALAEP